MGDQVVGEPKKGFDFKRDFIGEYDYSYLCTPQVPWAKTTKLPPFLARDEPISIMVATLMGLQHMLSMVGGLTTVPFVVAKFSMDGFPWKDTDLHQYMICAALICCGMFTLVQVHQIKIPGTRFVIGTGTISVLGTSFTFLPLLEAGIAEHKAQCMTNFGMVGKFGSYVDGENTRDMQELADYFPDRNCDLKEEDFKCKLDTYKPGMGCTSKKDYYFRCDATCASPGELNKCANEQCGHEAYGALLGTIVCCSLLECFISVLPIKVIQTIFPPVVRSVCVMLIGIGLVGSGAKYWAGGVVCGESSWKQHPHAGQVALGNMAICSGNAEVTLGFGSAEYLGLGFSVFVTLWLIEMFGSPFMKNTNVILALMLGYIISAASTFPVVNKGEATPEEIYANRLMNGATGQQKFGPLMSCDEFSENCVEKWSASYVTGAKIAQAPSLQFILTHRFPLSIYAPMILPALIAAITTTVETVGDIDATFDVSKLDRTGEDYNRAMQGGLMSDGLGSFFAALFTMPPNTTYSGNNGIIALTRCASKRAGYAAGIWLIIFGVFGKIAGVITSLPDCVLGGMTTFLFTQVFVSGMAMAPSPMQRRDRFVLGAAMAVGIGVAMQPYIFNDMRSGRYTGNVWRCESNEEVIQTAVNETTGEQTVTGRFPNPFYCSEGKKGFRFAVTVFFGTPYCIGTILAILLNISIPAEPPNVDEHGMVRDEIPGKGNEVVPVEEKKVGV